MVRVELFCVLHAHFDLEGARQANIENKHDYQVSLQINVYIKKTPLPLCLFFSSSVFSLHRSPSCPHSREANCREWEELGLLQFPLSGVIAIGHCTATLP